MKAEVARQIHELELLGFIEMSSSPMASPVVCVLKAKDKDGKRGLRIAIDYKYVNKSSSHSLQFEYIMVLSELGFHFHFSLKLVFVITYLKIIKLISLANLKTMLRNQTLPQTTPTTN